MNNIRQKIGFILFGLILFLMFLFVWHFIRSHLKELSLQQVNQRPTVVEMAQVKSESWSPLISSVGTVVAEQGITVMTPITGTVQTISFQSGQFVEAGTVLVQLDARLLQATADNSTAAYQAALSYYQRQQVLYTKKFISASDLETAKATMLEDKAQMEENNLLVQQATITAPFAGNVGLRQVSLGQFIQTGAAIVDLQSLDPIYVDFTLSEVYLSKIQVGNMVTVLTSAYPGEVFEGKIVALNSRFDSQTRTVNIRAELPNPDTQLIPGMFADVQVVLPSTNNVLVVPASTVQYSPFGDTVYVVQNGKASQRYVTVGEQRGTNVAITSGLSAGETIVSVGGNKLQSGMLVATQAQLQAASKVQAVANIKQQEAEAKS